MNPDRCAHSGTDLFPIFPDTDHLLSYLSAGNNLIANDPLVNVENRLSTKHNVSQLRCIKKNPGGRFCPPGKVSCFDRFTECSLHAKHFTN